jgi:hypothetical protein
LLFDLCVVLGLEGEANALKLSNVSLSAAPPPKDLALQSYLTRLVDLEGSYSFAPMLASICDLYPSKTNLVLS